MSVNRDVFDSGRSSTRRQFGKVVIGSAAGAFAVPAIVRGRNLNEKLNIAVIGVGGRGGSNLEAVSSENIVALCDVYEPALDAAAERHRQARRYADFRKVYDHANEFDAVVVSTTEHTHAFATLPGPAARQARLLREAADAQRLGGPGHPRGGREGQGRHADGDADPRRATTTAASSS